MTDAPRQTTSTVRKLLVCTWQSPSFRIASPASGGTLGTVDDSLDFSALTSSVLAMGGPSCSTVVAAGRARVAST
jgi:hypothetical protein